MEIANVVKAVRSEEMRVKKKKVFEVPKSTLKDKVTDKKTYGETDQYPTWMETSVAT
jgi:hypothetical protein